MYAAPHIITLCVAGFIWKKKREKMPWTMLFGCHTNLISNDCRQSRMILGKITQKKQQHTTNSFIADYKNFNLLFMIFGAEKWRKLAWYFDEFLESSVLCRRFICVSVCVLSWFRFHFAHFIESETHWKPITYASLHTFRLIDDTEKKIRPTIWCIIERSTKKKKHTARNNFCICIETYTKRLQLQQLQQHLISISRVIQ